MPKIGSIEDSDHWEVDVGPSSAGGLVEYSVSLENTPAQYCAHGRRVLASCVFLLFYLDRVNQYHGSEVA